MRHFHAHTRVFVCCAVSDNCVGCAISNDYDFTECFPGPDQQQCSESDLHALARIMLCPGAPSAPGAEDESAEHQACIDAATRTASDECFSCVMATGGSLGPCFQDAPAPAGQCTTDDAAALATAAVCDDLDCEKAALAQLTQPCLECGLAAALPSLPDERDPASASLIPFPDACLASPQQPYCRFDMDSNGMIGVDDLLVSARAALALKSCRRPPRLPRCLQAWLGLQAWMAQLNSIKLACAQGLLASFGRSC